jgi:hypothetical protein
VFLLFVGDRFEHRRGGGEDRRGAGELRLVKRVAARGGRVVAEWVGVDLDAHVFVQQQWIERRGYVTLREVGELSDRGARREADCIEGVKGQSFRA